MTYFLVPQTAEELGKILRFVLLILLSSGDCANAKLDVVILHGIEDDCMSGIAGGSLSDYVCERMLNSLSTI